MAITQNTYTGNGTNQDFVFSFTYLDHTHVKATINGTPTTAFTFFNASTLRFNTAPANGAAIRIYRETPSDNLLADYTAGSALREQDLELTLQQVLNVAQETQTFAANQSTTGLQAQITTANNTANNALVVANNANTTASGLSSSITTANANASAAVTTANNANTTASNALARAGGVMTGNITFANTQPLTGVSLNGGPLAGYRNKLINAGMLVDQRNSGAAVTLTGATTSGVVIDRWRCLNTGNTSSISFQQSTLAPTGFARSIRALINTTKTPASTDQAVIYQPIEGLNVQDLAYGTASALPTTLSFWARASGVGDFSGSVRIRTSGGAFSSYVFSYTISSTNTWQFFSFNIPGNTGTSPDISTSEGLSVLFDLGSGSTFSTASINSWQAGNFFKANSSASLVLGSAATLNITGVQLEVGNLATPFERRPIGIETHLCQRYFEKIYARLGGYGLAGNGSFINIPFKATKRATPTIGWNTVTATNTSTANAQAQNLDEFLHFAIPTTTNFFEWSANVTADAEL